MTEISRPMTGLVSLGAPGDAGPYSAEDWRTTWRNIGGNWGAVNNRGVFYNYLNDLQVTPTSPATNSVNIGAGAALVAGGWYHNDAPLSVTPAANSSGSLRVDVVVIQFDYVAQTIRGAIHQGTPGGGVPTLTQSIGTIFEIPLAYLNLSSGFSSIAASDVIDIREYVNIAERVGVIGTNVSGGTLEGGEVVVWDFSSPQQYTTTLVPNTPNVAGVVESRTLNNGRGRLITQGLAFIMCDEAVSAGDYLTTSNTAGQARIVTGQSANAFARVLADNAGPGSVALCYINVPVEQRANPACTVRKTTNTSIANAATVAVSMDEEIEDTDDFHSTITNPSRLTIPVGCAGRYLITANARFTGMNPTSGPIANSAISVRLNGTAVLGSANGATNATINEVILSLSFTRTLLEGEYVELIATCTNQTGSQTLTATAEYSPYFSIVRIGG